MLSIPIGTDKICLLAGTHFPRLPGLSCHTVLQPLILACFSKLHLCLKERVDGRLT